jgi:hypothetical protein
VLGSVVPCILVFCGRDVIEAERGDDEGTISLDNAKKYERGKICDEMREIVR